MSAHILQDRKGRSQDAIPRPELLLLPGPERIHHAVLSHDESFWRKLSIAARKSGRVLLRESAAGFLELQKLNAATVIIDLDEPMGGPWETADNLLQEPECPPLLLLTSRKYQDEFDTAIQAGSLVDKTKSPDHLLTIAESALVAPADLQRERKAMQRIVVRWLKPCSWNPPIVPQMRHWGINE